MTTKAEKAAEEYIKENFVDMGNNADPFRKEPLHCDFLAAQKDFLAGVSYGRAEMRKEILKHLVDLPGHSYDLCQLADLRHLIEQLKTGGEK